VSKIIDIMVCDSNGHPITTLNNYRVRKAIFAEFCAGDLGEFSLKKAFDEIVRWTPDKGQATIVLENKDTISIILNGELLFNLNLFTEFKSSLSSQINKNAVEQVKKGKQTLYLGDWSRYGIKMDSLKDPENFGYLYDADKIRLFNTGRLLGLKDPIEINSGAGSCENAQNIKISQNALKLAIDICEIIPSGFFLE